MGLGAVLTRSSPNLQPASQPPATPYVVGPEQQFPSYSRVLPEATETAALSVPAFWRGHGYVTSTVGMLPVTVYRGTDAIDPAPPVIRQPDPNQTPMAFWAGCASSLTLYGNSICIITSTDRTGYPATLKPIHPTLAAVRFTGNPMAPTIDSWYVAGQMYDPSEIWHVKSHLGRAGWPLGRGVLDVNSDAIATALALQGYAAGYFNNSGMPAGILKVHRPEVTQQQADDAKTAWISKFSGAPSVAVLNELTDFTPVAFRPVDSQMIESRQFDLVQIALLWGVPPSKLSPFIGSTYKNAEMEEVQARNDAVAPWTNLLEQAGSIQLVPRGQRLVWDLSASLRTDTLSQFQAYQLALGGPGPTSQWLLPDEVRARENLDPMAVVEAEMAAELPEGLVPEPGELDQVQPALPPVADAPDTGNEAFGAAGNPKGATA